MTRVKISVGILAALIAVGIFSCVWASNRCSRLIDSLENIRAAVSDENTEAAADKTEKFMDEWESFRNMASVMVKRDKLSEIDRIRSRIISLMENDSDELQSELSELINMIELLRDREIPVITSIF